MAQITFKGDAVNTEGWLPQTGTKAFDSVLTDAQLADRKISDITQGKKAVLNIFPSVDTGVCAASVRKFNEKAASLSNTIVLCISKDLPFAQARFCAAEGLNNVVMLSDFRSSFGHDYGVIITDGPLKGLLSRSVVVLDAQGNVIYNEQVAETGNEPNYEAALQALQ